MKKTQEGDFLLSLINGINTPLIPNCFSNEIGYRLLDDQMIPFQINCSETALKAAWINALIHRDYSFNGSTVIYINHNFIEFISPGGLVPGLNLESISLGISQTRNPHLASLFENLRLTPNCGRGIRQIREKYIDTMGKPSFENAMGVFRIIIPQFCYNPFPYLFYPPINSSQTLNREEEKQNLLHYIKTRHGITKKEARDYLNSGNTKAYTLLKELCNENLIYIVRKGRYSYYLPQSEYSIPTPIYNKKIFK